MNNSIIDEVREARAALAEEHGYDREKILEWARGEQAKLKSKNPNKACMAAASKTSDQNQHQDAAPSV